MIIYVGRGFGFASGFELWKERKGRDDDIYSR